MQQVLKTALPAAIVTGCWAQSTPSTLDEDIKRLLSEEHIPSVSIAQIKDAKIVRLSRLRTTKLVCSCYARQTV
jgi:hypothetical protein